MLSLLKLKSSKVLTFSKFAKLISFSALFSVNLYAQENAQQDWQVHGFVAQGIINVNGSDFVNDDGDLSAELTEVGINGSYKLSDSFRLTGQAVYLDGGNRYVEGARIDYALIDWSVYNDEQWLVNLYLGRFKNNHWLYSSTRDIPHARPSIILPQGLYFDGLRDIAMGSDGGAMKVNYNSELYGDFDFNLSYGTSDLSSDSVKLLLGEIAHGTGKQEFDVQSSLYWRPQFSPWQFGISTLNSDFTYKASANDVFPPGFPHFAGAPIEDATFSFNQVAINALYEGEYWEFSAEVFQQAFKTEGFYPPPLYASLGQNSIEKVGQGIYLQSRYKLNENLTLMARVERLYADKDDRDGSQLELESGGNVPHYFGFQHDFTLGIHYSLSESLLVQMEYHWLEGTARLTPVVSPNVLINHNKHWDMWAVQLMYWF